jgi:uncharacterized protein (TIGR03000 family)
MTMVITRVLILSGVLVCGLDACAPSRANEPLSGQPAAQGLTASRVTVTVPQDDAELAVDGEAVEGEGMVREYRTPPVARGTTREYTFTATWRPNGYTTMTRSKVVPIRSGQQLKVDLAVEDPADRVRVIYVPTPADVAEEMVDLAGVTAKDVVYEPGCGDARITIAAVRRGAQRAICIDIEPERAEESRANVSAAGLADKIDVRLGDALDVKDLSEVTVVFLYMGDHFNLLLRPVLWRDLPVGSRVVSHRFTMGDWKPDRTITVGSADGGEWILHLWTITEEVKRRQSRTQEPRR